MTIAACYVTPEGIVLGADSTSSLMGTSGAFHYYNHNQKLFEIGENSTLGILTWGLGGIGLQSYRTLIAEVADDLAAKPAADMADVANRWIEKVWPVYCSTFKGALDQCEVLSRKKPHNPANPTEPGTRSADEEKLFAQLKGSLCVGFCVAGYVLPNRVPQAFQMTFDPVAGKPAPAPVTQTGFWGAPNMIKRLIWGADDGIKEAILKSGKWNGDANDIDVLLRQYALGHHILPIRDAIDFVHSCIYSTIKAMKFSNLYQICGGPIELAVITTDRKFRWVWHKDWDAAIIEGEHR